MNEQAAVNLVLNRTKIKIIEAAERLFAQKGIDKVSTREIAREAGQKNHSALHYHFGSIDELINAIFDYRMIPVDDYRKYLFEKELEKTDDLSLRDLIYILVAPVAEKALNPSEKNYFLIMLAQLLSRSEWRDQYLVHQNRQPCSKKIGMELYKKLTDSMGEKVAFERLKMMGATIMITIAEWNLASQDEAFKKARSTNSLFSKDYIESSFSDEEKIDDLLDFLIGAITQPSSAKAQKKIKILKV
jgi:AcrR family transcriptional regulator